MEKVLATVFFRVRLYFKSPIQQTVSENALRSKHFRRVGRQLQVHLSKRRAHQRFAQAGQTRWRVREIAQTVVSLSNMVFMAINQLEQAQARSQHSRGHWESSTVHSPASVRQHTFLQHQVSSTRWTLQYPKPQLILTLHQERTQWYWWTTTIAWRFTKRRSDSRSTSPSLIGSRANSSSSWSDPVEILFERAFLSFNFKPMPINSKRKGGLVLEFFKLNNSRTLRLKPLRNEFGLVWDFSWKSCISRQLVRPFYISRPKTLVKKARGGYSDFVLARTKKVARVTRYLVCWLWG